MPDNAQKSAFSVSVYRSDALHVVNGANLGDPLSFADELIADDIYMLDPTALMDKMGLCAGENGSFTITNDTNMGTPGSALHLDSCLTLMTRDGQTADVLVLVEVDELGLAIETYGLPFVPLQPKTEYSLVGIDREAALGKFAQVACVSFSRGTHITMASGAQTKIEDLQIGDRVLTRDDGPQKVRWIGKSTVRAVGEFAPILIHAGALHNENDLLVSPDHRLFFYQRSDALGAGRAELLVKARHLINGTTVTVQEGGFVDYFQLLFDSHQIIYAEGIAAETLLVDTRTKSALPADLDDSLAEILPAHSKRSHLEFEVQENLLDTPDAAELLRRASTR